jgi:hypothetical protein
MDAHGSVEESRQRLWAGKSTRNRAGIQSAVQRRPRSDGARGQVGG